MQISYSTELSMEAKQSEGIDNVYPLKAIQFFSPPPSVDFPLAGSFPSKCESK